MRADRAFVLLAATHAGPFVQPNDIAPKWASVLSAAAPELRADKEIVLAACRAYGYYEFADAAPALQADRDVILASGAHLNLLSPNCPLLADREIVKLAISKRPCDLQYAAAELRDDDEIVMAATELDGLAGEYASARLKEDSVIAGRLRAANDEMERAYR